MINQICYVLTSSGTDLYAQMTLISVSLSRRLYPDVQIVILVDEITDINLKKCNSPLIKLASRIIRVETGIEKTVPRSRFLKTSMRQLVEGEFIYMDVDAFPIRHFDEMTKTDTPIAVALDVDYKLDKPYLPLLVRENILKCGWEEIPISNYFNSGVFFMADTPETRQFGIEWHNRWKEMWEKTGDHRDQPSFNYAIHLLKVKKHILPPEFNAAVRVNPWRAKNAKIIHYWIHSANDQLTCKHLLSHLISYQNEKSEIDWRACHKQARKKQF